MDPVDGRFDSYMAEVSSLGPANELDKYLMESPEPRNNNYYILDWWKINESRFPILARMARDVLVIPITTVPSESIFSTGGRVLSIFRSSLTPKTAEGLLLTQNWLKEHIGIEALSQNDGTEDPVTYELDGVMELDPKNII